MLKFTNLIIVSIASLTLIGCGGFKGNNNTVTGSGLVPTEARIAQNRAVVSMVNRNQSFANLLTCTGLTESDLPGNLQIPNAGQTNRRTQLLNAMSAEGVADDMSAGRAKALLDLSAEVCGALIQKETGGDRIYFPGFEFNGNNGGGAISISGTAQSLASSCWGRAAVAGELDIIERGIASVERVNSDNGFDKAIFICTAVLGSASAIKF